MRKINNNSLWIILTIVFTCSLVVILSLNTIKHNELKNAEESFEQNTSFAYVAKVNGTELSLEYFQKQIDLMAFSQGVPKSSLESYPSAELVKQVIINYLVLGKAKHSNYSFDFSNKETEFDNMLSNRGFTRDEFDTYLINESFNSYEFIEFAGNQETIRQYIRDELFKNISLTKKEQTEYYEEHLIQYTISDQIRVRHILVNSSEEAESILKLLNEGRNFSKLAQEYSLGPSATKGGDLGYFTRGQMVLEFENRAFNLDIGEYTKTPVQTQFGFHIIKLVDRIHEAQQSYDDVKEQIKQNLTLAKQEEKLVEYTTDLYEESGVELYPMIEEVI